jgi:hypothetical protein
MSDNTVGWQEYVTRLIDEQEHKTALRFAASQRAVDHAMSALDYRLESMNEFRSQIQTERTGYATKESLEELRKRVETMERGRATGDGRFWALGIGITVTIAAITAVITVVVRMALK